MNKTAGEIITEKRKALDMTQKNLADKLNVTVQAVSRWERNVGLPDITILKHLSEILNLSLTEILNGCVTSGDNKSGNIDKIKFYICPLCGNIVTSFGTADISCCGNKLEPIMQEPAEADSAAVSYENGEIRAEINNPMTKENYITFISYIKRYFNVKKTLSQTDGGSGIFL